MFQGGVGSGAPAGFLGSQLHTSLVILRPSLPPPNIPAITSPSPSLSISTSALFLRYYYSTCYELAARYFRTCIQFSLSPPTITDPYDNPRTPIPLTSLPSSFARKYHFKDTAIYNLSVRDVADIEDAFDVIWKSWYPRWNTERGMDKNPEGFFCRAMKLEGVFSTDIELNEVVGFHEELVRVIDEDEEDRKRLKAQGGEEITPEKARFLERGLEESFRKVIVVLDKKQWEKDGVLVVCRMESAGEFGFMSGECTGDEEKGRENLKDQGRLMDGRWVAFRKGLAEAVETVICDPERKKAEAPTEEYYRNKKFGF